MCAIVNTQAPGCSLLLLCSFFELTSCLRFAQFETAPKLFLCKLFKEASAAVLLAKQRPLCCSYNKTSSYLVGFGVKATRVGLNRAPAVKGEICESVTL